jgi:hypothetical protein
MNAQKQCFVIIAAVVLILACAGAPSVQPTVSVETLPPDTSAPLTSPAPTETLPTVTLVPPTSPAPAKTQPTVTPEQLPVPGGKALNANPPSAPMRLIFIHHSTGEGWLADDQGGLGLALRDNSYFVSDTNYGWGPDGIGDTTDIGHWFTWFRGPQSATYLSALYAESEQHAEYSRLANAPSGENTIILFKSCFPNSHLEGKPNDPPATGNNPLREQESASEHMTVANAKGIYNDLLPYFATRQDKLFVVITAPPLTSQDSSPANAANARGLNNWLVKEWLSNYPHKNVLVFDFYNVLTSNGGNVGVNDLGQERGNHHRFWKGAVQHVQTVNNNLAAFASAPDDSHPTAAGGQKATGEFVPLLNIAVHCWLGDGGCLR